MGGDLVLFCFRRKNISGYSDVIHWRKDAFSVWKSHWWKRKSRYTRRNTLKLPSSSRFPLPFPKTTATISISFCQLLMDELCLNHHLGKQLRSGDLGLGKEVHLRLTGGGGPQVCIRYGKLRQECSPNHGIFQSVRRFLSCVLPRVCMYSNQKHLVGNQGVIFFPHCAFWTLTCLQPYVIWEVFFFFLLCFIYFIFWQVYYFYWSFHWDKHRFTCSSNKL